MSLISFMIALLLVIIPFAFMGVCFYVYMYRSRMDPRAEELFIRRPILLPITVAVLVGVLNIFAYDVTLGFGVSVFLSSIVVTLLLLIEKEKRGLLAYILACTGVFASFGLAFRANGFVQSLDAIAVLCVSGLLIFIGSVHVFRWDGLWFLRAKFDYLTRLFFNLPFLISRGSSADTKGSRQIVSAIKTLLITLFVFVVFAGLLSSADPNFAQVISELRDQAFGRVIISVFFTVLFVVLVMVKIPEKDNDNRDPLFFISPQDLFGPMLVIVLLIGLFIFLQAKYLFANQAEFLTFGITYSDYVRKGFIELLVASFLGGIIAYAVFLKTRLLSTERNISGLLATNVIMIMGLFMLLISALKRDLLYLDVYGLTRTRFIGGMFLFWLAGLFIMLLLITLRKKVVERHLFAVMGVLGILFLVIMNGVNIDQYIAQNYRPGDFNNEVDYYYINQLSEDAVLGWKDSILYAKSTWADLSQIPQLPDEQVKKYVNIKLALITLVEKREELEMIFGSDAKVRQILRLGFSEPIPLEIAQKRKLFSHNFSQKSAYKMMQSQKSLFYADVDCLLANMFSFEVLNKIDAYDDEYHVMFETERPFVSVKNSYQPVETLPVDPYIEGFSDWTAKDNLYSFLEEHNISKQCVLSE